MPNVEFGKLLIILGVFIVFVGIILMTINKIPFLGKLPGDIRIQKGNFSFYFPLVTCILISVIFSLVFWFFSKR